MKYEKVWCRATWMEPAARTASLFPIIGVPRYDDAIITSEVGHTPWAADCLKNKEEYEQGVGFYRHDPKYFNIIPPPFVI